VLLSTLGIGLSTARADTIYVDANSTGDYPTIQAAINVAIDGDEVVLMPGTYTGDGNRDIDFQGKAITVRSENGAANCIIDCEGSEEDRHQGFRFISGEDANSILDGLTVTGGYAFIGGGIYCDNSSPTIHNCRIINNHAGNAGGGMSCWESGPIISQCVFHGNWVGHRGDAISLSYSTPTIKHCTMTENKMYGQSECIYSYASNFVITPMQVILLLPTVFCGTTQEHLEQRFG
jgi:hypothetical protein